MKEDRIIKIYEVFLKYYYASLILILMIISIFNFSWFPRFICYIEIFIFITGEVGLYIDYVLYKDKLGKNK